MELSNACICKEALHQWPQGQFQITIVFVQPPHVFDIKGSGYYEIGRWVARHSVALVIH
jgi:hypothetical protein